jgi:hypothetical protein
MKDTLAAILEAIKGLEATHLLLAFVLLSGLLAPGTAVIWIFDPTFIYEKDVSKLLFLSLVLTTPPCLFNFVVFSTFWQMRGHPGDKQSLGTVFTFSVLSIAISYSLVVFVSLICKLKMTVFSLLALLLDILLVALFVKLMPKK